MGKLITKSSDTARAFQSDAASTPLRQRRIRRGVEPFLPSLLQETPAPRRGELLFATFFPGEDREWPIPLHHAGHTLGFSPRRRQRLTPQLLGARDAFSAIASGKTTSKLTPKWAAHVGTSSAPAWQACTPSALPPERAEPAASSGFLPWALSYPLPSLSALSHPCIVLQQRSVQVDDKHEGCADSGCENPFSSCLSLPRCC